MGLTGSKQQTTTKKVVRKSTNPRAAALRIEHQTFERQQKGTAHEKQKHKLREKW